MAATTRTHDLMSRPPTQYGLSCASLSANKSFVFVKLTEQALLAIEQYVQQSKGPSSQKPSIQFQKNSNLGAISIPGHGSGKKFNFALSQVDGPSSSSLECIRQSKNKRTMQSLGKIRYKLKVQATDEIYETTRAKMAAANTAAKQNVPKVIKESGPRVGRKFKGTTAVAAAHKSFVSSGRALGSNSSSGNQPAISVTAPVDKSGPLPPKKGPRIAHSSALLSVPSPQQAYPVSNGRPAVGSVMNNNKYSSEKKSELKSHSRSPSSSLQTNGYSDLISHWANKPTSPSVPEPAPSSQKSSHSDAGSSCSSQTSAASPLSADDRQKLKSEFNAHYSVYKSLYSTLQEVSSKFWKLEEKLKNSVEGSEEWNNIMDTILKQYEELKKDEKFQDTKSRVVAMHQKLAGLKRKIRSVDAGQAGDNSFKSCNRFKRFKGEDVMANKFDDNNNDRRTKNLTGALLAI